VINVELPAGYHSIPPPRSAIKYRLRAAPRPCLSISKNASRTAKSLQLPIRIPLRAMSAGVAELRVSFTFVYLP